MSKTALYRHFDAGRRLAHVGISGSHLIPIAEMLAASQEIAAA